jgi:4a-hydroxytetrahydrobiopterin dehydratase
MKRLGAAEIAKALGALPGWRGDGEALRAEYRFADFRAAFAFMTAVAEAAEAQQHHPDWSNSYARVRIDLSTHDAGGVTSKDVDLARRIVEFARAHGGKAEPG